MGCMLSIIWDSCRFIWHEDKLILSILLHILWFLSFFLSFIWIIFPLPFITGVVVFCFWLVVCLRVKCLKLLKFYVDTMLSSCLNIASNSTIVVSVILKQMILIFSIFCYLQAMSIISTILVSVHLLNPEKAGVKLKIKGSDFCQILSSCFSICYI